jgi:N6-L-threonylcarbamoyladenine synthase
MIILGIDTSCDDTCIALLKIENCKLRILSNIVSSQVKLHAKYGGVYPSLAKREHQRNLAPVLKKALEEARLLKLKIKNQKSKIDVIGVTVGPGLEPCLWQGVNFAKDLARKLNLPIVSVNHIEAHILANTINNQQLAISNFPAICLIVSGGHTQLILMKGIGKYKLIGETRDDAAGECFDKVARILGLGYPGGPVIMAEASKFGRGQTSAKLPRPMMYTKDYDFSFSGLKTAVLYDFKKRLPKIRKSKTYIQAICAETQQAIIDVLIHKTLKAAKDFKTKSIILGGGVAANEELRKQFQEKIKKDLPNIQYLIPNIHFCTDNAAMVAMTAYFHRKEKFNLSEIKANANLKI